jgi:group I intron endonuclease
MKGVLEISKSKIYSAILKHGHENFSLSIIEYCEVDKCIEREDYYFKLLKPKYNILKKLALDWVIYPLMNLVKKCQMLLWVPKNLKDQEDPLKQ